MSQYALSDCLSGPGVSISNCDICYIHGGFCNVFKAPGVDTDQTPCKSEPRHFPANIAARLQQAVHRADSITQTPVHYNSIQYNGSSVKGIFVMPVGRTLWP